MLFDLFLARVFRVQVGFVAISMLQSSVIAMLDWLLLICLSYCMIFAIVSPAGKNPSTWSSRAVLILMLVDWFCLFLIGLENPSCPSGQFYCVVVLRFLSFRILFKVSSLEFKIFNNGLRFPVWVTSAFFGPLVFGIFSFAARFLASLFWGLLQQVLSTKKDLPFTRFGLQRSRFRD